MNTVSLELTIDQVNVVLAALGKLPLEVSVDAFAAIRGQVDPQVLAAQPPAPEAE